MKKAAILATVWMLAMSITAFSRDHRDPGEQRFDAPSNGRVINIPLGGTIILPDLTSLLNGDGRTSMFSVGGSRLASVLTGPDSPERTDEQWNIAGTDLGFTFEHDGRLYMVFGDTWGRDGVEGVDWRSNVMVVVEPHPEHGYIITDAVVDENGEAKELIPSLKIPEEEYTIIPNTGISIDGRMYLHYMSVNDWDKHWWGYKEPLINGSGFAYSDDDGQTWTKADSVEWEGNTPFAQGSLVEHDGHIYFFGATADRFGPLHLLRVEPDHLLDPEHYEYWDGIGWTDDPYAVREILPGPVGEMSVRWSDHHQRWIMMYKNEISHNIVMRTALEPQGPWDFERVVASSAEYRTLYAPMLLPIEDERIHFAMSVFLPTYQVFLMEVVLN